MLNRLLPALACAMCFAFVSVSAAEQKSKIQSTLSLQFKAKPADETVRVIVNLDNATPRGIKKARAIADRQGRVIKAFKNENNGKGLGILRQYETVFGFSAELTRQQAEKLAKHVDVTLIEEMPMHSKNYPESHPLTEVDLAQGAFDGTGAVIAIIDDGIDTAHPAFAGKYLGGYDFADFDNDPTIDCASQSHGTAVAGVALGNGGGALGVAPGADMVFLKIQGASICGSTSLDGDIIGAIDWVVANKDTYGIDIISMSLGGGLYSSESSCNNSSSLYRTVISNAVDAGITVVAASGNDGMCDSMSRPACFSDVVSVGAVYDESLGSTGWCVNANSCATTEPHSQCTPGAAAFETAVVDNVIVYSNSASFLDVAAPATCATSAAPNGGTTDCFGGTSSATPFTSGIAALAVEAAGKGVLTPADMLDVLVVSGDSVTDPKNGRISPRVNGIEAVLLAETFGGPVNNPPTASFSYNCTDLNCSFNGSGSSDDGTIASYAWTFGDGASGSGATPNHNYSAAGSYTVTLTVTDDGGLTDSTSQSVTVTAPVVNDPPVASFDSSCSDLDCSFTDTSSDDNGVASWSWSFDDGGSSTAQNPNHTYAAAGSYTVSLTVMDGDGENDSTSTLVTVTGPPPPADFKLETGVANGVSSSGWTTVVLPQSFTSMVVVATVNYDGTDLPAVTRISNASGNSFDVSLANPGGSAVGPHPVHYLVVEEGVFTEVDDGITMEAVKYTSNVTGRKNGWAWENQSFSNSYASPVVLGQVMSYNDSDWSVFWATGSSRTAPPSASSLGVGKHIGEDTDTVRADEVVGYIVMEAGSGAINGIEYTAGVGSDIVRGPSNTPPFSYPISGVSAPSSAVVSAAALDGGDGGWPLLYGDNPVSAGNLDLMFDEDQVGDSERSHTTEQVAYAVFGTEGANTPPTASFTDSCTDLSCDFTDSSSDSDGTIVAWSWDFGDGNASSAQSPSHSYASAGSYTVSLIVTDNGGATDSSNALVTVTAPNVPPTAAFTSSCSDLDCDFTDTSSDSDGNVTSWSWDFGDGATSNAQDPNHSYAAAGSYTVSLTVTDNSGASDGFSANVTVSEPPVGWSELTFDDFENGWGNWVDGGNDARLSSTWAVGNQTMALQDNSSTSFSQLSSSLDLSGYSELRIEFSYVVRSFENTEDFWVRFSSDGGSTWQTIEAYVNNVDFVDDGTRYEPEIVIDSSSYSFGSDVLIRFQCDASGNGDDVYIDNIRISAQ